MWRELPFNTEGVDAKKAGHHEGRAQGKTRRETGGQVGRAPRVIVIEESDPAAMRKAGTCLLGTSVPRACAGRAARAPVWGHHDVPRRAAHRMLKSSDRRFKGRLAAGVVVDDHNSAREYIFLSEHRWQGAPEQQLLSSTPRGYNDCNETLASSHRCFQKPAYHVGDQG